MQGQTSREVRHDGQQKRDRQQDGLQGVGASGAPGSNQMVDEREDPRQRGLEKEEAAVSGQRGDKGSGGAEV